MTEKEIAFRFLRSLRIGDAVVLSNGDVMFVARELELGVTEAYRTPNWDFANVHLVEGPGHSPISVTVMQQAEKRDLVWIKSRIEDHLIRVVPLNDDVFRSIDRIVKDKQQAANVKTALGRRAKRVRADALPV